MDADRIPRVAAVASAFFVASLIHVPIGPSSAHLVLNGLAGLLLGWAAFPALLVALLLQAVFFQFGGLTTLGVNVMNMALPAVLCHYLFRRAVRRGGGTSAAVAGALAGGGAIFLACLFWAACLATAGESFAGVIVAGLLAHSAVIPVEGALTGAAVAFLRRVRPETLEGSLGQEKDHAMRSPIS
jgi:cobalt/nickel transport system permease protein